MFDFSEVLWSERLERKRDCCCYGDVTWAEQSKQRGYFSVIKFII